VLAEKLAIFLSATRVRYTTTAEKYSADYAHHLLVRLRQKLERVDKYL